MITLGGFRPCPKPEPVPKKKGQVKIRARSQKRAKQEAGYAKRAKEFIKGKPCAVHPERPAECVHHMKGRVGKMLDDEQYWLAVSFEGHRKIEDNPEWAYENGFSMSRLSNPK